MEINRPDAVADGVVVSLDYSLTVDGQVIDSTQNSAPLEYLHGHRNLIPGLERELTGMIAGASKEVFVSAKDAYGEYDPNAFAEVERSQFPPNFELVIGAELRIRDDNGRIYNASVQEIGDESVRLDLNHPLAGKDLKFNVTVASLRAAEEDELASGRVGGGCAGCSSESCGSEGCH